MEIHELNTFSGTLGSGDYFATDNGTDTSKVSAEAMLAPLNARIDNIIAGPASSAEEVVDGRLGAEVLGSKTYPSLGAAIRGQVTDLSDDLSDLKSDLNKAVTITNPNLYNIDDPDLLDGKYLNPNGTLESYAGRLVTGYIPVQAGKKVTISRQVNGNAEAFPYSAICLYNASKSVVTGGNYNQYTFTIPSGVNYVRITIANNFVGVQIELTDDGVPTKYYPYGEYAIRLNDDVVVKGIPPVKTKYAKVDGNLSSGGILKIPSAKTNIRKGERIVFSGDFTTFDVVVLGLCSDPNNVQETKINFITVDGSSLSYSNSSSAAVTVEHGLTIESNIQIIYELGATGTVKVTLISNGVSYTHEFQYVRWGIGLPFAYVSASMDCSITWTCADICKNIWLFGDSYISPYPERWVYYLNQHGYDKNVLLDGFAGEGSTNARISLGNLVQFGTPKYAVWCMGMNDGSDTNANTPSASWTNERDHFLNYCNSNDIEPIFATIPNVPSILHTGKNAWVKASGYRYIDFAQAVGATAANSTWYDGMLSDDNVHPTVKGAKALFARVLLDLPEIMIDDFGY